MSPHELMAELRANRPVAPTELRHHIRQLAASVPEGRRRFTWRRALVVAIAVAGLAAVAGVLGTKGYLGPARAPILQRGDGPERVSGAARSVPSDRMLDGSAFAAPAP